MKTHKLRALPYVLMLLPIDLAVAVCLLAASLAAAIVGRIKGTYSEFLKVQNSEYVPLIPLKPEATLP